MKEKNRLFAEQPGAKSKGEFGELLNFILGDAHGLPTICIPELFITEASAKNIAAEIVGLGARFTHTNGIIWLSCKKGSW